MHCPSACIGSKEGKVLSSRIVKPHLIEATKILLKINSEQLTTAHQESIVHNTTTTTDAAATAAAEP